MKKLFQEPKLNENLHLFKSTVLESYGIKFTIKTSRPCVDILKEDLEPLEDINEIEVSEDTIYLETGTSASQITFLNSVGGVILLNKLKETKDKLEELKSLEKSSNEVIVDTLTKDGFLFSDDLDLIITLRYNTENNFPLVGITFFDFSQNFNALSTRFTLTESDLNKLIETLSDFYKEKIEIANKHLDLYLKENEK